MDDTIKRIGLIDENVKLKKCEGRNEGIIETSKEGIEENRYWEEARLTVNIDKKSIKFEVISEISEEDIKEYYEDAKIEEINRNFEEIKFEDVFELKCFIDTSCYKDQYVFFNKFNNKHIALIQ